METRTVHIPTIFSKMEPLCNTLKHIITNDIPCYAIDIVTVYENNSVITDDMLSLRLGLIPIKLDPRVDIKELEFSIDVEYDKNKSDNGMHIIYSNDITLTNVIPGLAPVTDIIQQNIPISVLCPGQKLQITATAIVSTGYEHAKWSTVCAPFFDKRDNKYYLKIEPVGSRSSQSIYNESIDILLKQIQNVIVNIRV